MLTQRVFSGVIWERQVGYCRAIKKGNFIAILGTTAIDDKGAFLRQEVPTPKLSGVLYSLKKRLNK